MSFSVDEMNEIKKEFDDRYVLQSDCNEKQESFNKINANNDKRIEIISHDFAAIKKLMWTIATSSIGALVVALFELILK